MRQTIFVDSMNLVYRSHFAHRGLADKRGRPTSVLYGYLNALRRLEKKFLGADIVVAWEQGVGVNREGPRAVTWRKQLFPDYKAQRKRNEETEVALSQLPTLYRVLRLLGYLQLECRGLEADDVIGVCTAALGGQRFIYSTDEDFYQLVSPSVRVIKHPMGRSRTLGLTTVDEKAVRRLTGVDARDFPKLKALMGDSSDNYKPLKGVGPKRALVMFREGVDPSAARFDNLPTSVRSKYIDLQPLWKVIHLCYQLAVIPRHPEYKAIPRELRGALHDAAHAAKRKATRRIAKDDLPRRLDSFARFAASYDMVQMLADRRKYFSNVTVI